MSDVLAIFFCPVGPSSGLRHSARRGGRKPRGSAPSPREAEIRHKREGRSEKEGRDEQMTESVYHRSRHLALLMSMFRAVCIFDGPDQVRSGFTLHAGVRALPESWSSTSLPGVAPR